MATRLTQSTGYLGEPYAKCELRISVRALRTVQKHGGLDLYLLKTADKDLAEEGLRLKRRIVRKLSKPTKPTAAADAS